MPCLMRSPVQPTSASVRTMIVKMRNCDFPTGHHPSPTGRRRQGRCAKATQCFGNAKGGQGQG